MDFTVTSMSGHNFLQEFLCKNCWKPTAVICPHFQSSLLNLGWKNPAESFAQMNPHLQLNAADGISYSLILDNINAYKLYWPAPCAVQFAFCWFVREFAMIIGPEQLVLYDCSQGVCGNVGYCSVQLVELSLECLRETFTSSVSDSALNIFRQLWSI